MSASGAAAVWQVALATMVFEVMRRTGADGKAATFAVEQATLLSHSDEGITAEAMLDIVDAAARLIRTPA